jgi:hypothetical protein
MSEVALDAAGRRRSPATMPGLHAGRPPRNKGVRYPAGPPTIEEIVAVMRAAGDNTHGRRLRALIVVPWRARFADPRSARARRNRTSTDGADRCLSAAARAAGVARSAWTNGRRGPRSPPHELAADGARRRRFRPAPASPRARGRGHSNLGITSVYLQRIIETVHGGRAPMIPVRTTLRL